MIHGTLTKLADGSHVVTFERVIARPVTKVWAALTDPAILRNWLGEVHVEPHVGGRYEIHFREMTVVMTGRGHRPRPLHLHDLVREGII